LNELWTSTPFLFGKGIVASCTVSSSCHGSSMMRCVTPLTHAYNKAAIACGQRERRPGESRMPTKMNASLRSKQFGPTQYRCVLCLHGPKTHVGTNKSILQRRPLPFVNSRGKGKKRQHRKLSPFISSAASLHRQKSSPSMPTIRAKSPTQ